MTKKDALNQLLWDRTAIDGYEGFIRAVAFTMDSTRENLLSCAGFTGNKDSDIR